MQTDKTHKLQCLSRKWKGGKCVLEKSDKFVKSAMSAKMHRFFDVSHPPQIHLKAKSSEMIHCVDW
jgi:hypothetical protein